MTITLKCRDGVSFVFLPIEAEFSLWLCSLTITVANFYNCSTAANAGYITFSATTLTVNGQQPVWSQCEYYATDNSQIAFSGSNVVFNNDPNLHFSDFHGSMQLSVINCQITVASLYVTLPAGSQLIATGNTWLGYGGLDLSNGVVFGANNIINMNNFRTLVLFACFILTVVDLHFIRVQSSAAARAGPCPPAPRSTRCPWSSPTVCSSSTDLALSATVCCC